MHHVRLLALLCWLATLSPIAGATPLLYAPAQVRHALRLPDGSLIATGNFTAVGETPRAGIAKLTAAGELDPAWNPPGLPDGFAAQAVALAASPDGTQLYIATNSQIADIYTTAAGAAVPGFEVTATGSVDGGNSGIRAIAVDPSGLLYVAGAFAYINSSSRNALARLSAAGVLDDDWNASANSTVAALQIDPSGGFVYIGGAFVSVDSATHFRLARVHLADGSADASWNPSVSSTSDGIHALALSAASDTVFVAGNFSSINTTARGGFARVLTASGALDAWNPPFAGYGVRAIVAASDFVYVGGDLGCCNAGTLARADAGSGAIDAAFVTALDGPVDALLADAEQAVLAFGEFGNAGDTPTLGAAAISSAATASHALPDFEIEGSAGALASEADGSALLAGDFEKVDHVYRAGLCRLEGDGSLDTLFDPPHTDDGAWLAVASDPFSGAVYAGGSFTKVGGAAHTFVARLDGATGALDATWTPLIDDAPYSGSVQALAVDQGAVYIGGDFSKVNGVARVNLAELTAAGALVPGATTATNGTVTRIAIDGDGVYVGGTFLSPRTRLAKLHRSDGSWDSGWNPAFGWVTTWSDLFDLKAFGGNVYASTQAAIPFGGGVVEVGEIVRIDASGSAAPIARFNQPAFAILGARDAGSLYAAGSFQTLYAIDDFFAQTARPAGLAQISLRPGTLGVPESWSPSVPSASGVPGLVPLGTGIGGLLAGSRADMFSWPRPGLDMLGLPPGEFLFKAGFEP